ncbi:hypothetical protein E2C01_053888 [Portunus trituberculatus]|uniref:Uncharacterized protein n=1 Tax=Portunus trituberculatus TaxID=210409 RepID=A0A5B7GHV7_PORTR|nr:hypothetical protein [Portunus trituberculatus]
MPASQCLAPPGLWHARGAVTLCSRDHFWERDREEEEEEEEEEKKKNEKEEEGDKDESCCWWWWWWWGEKRSFIRVWCKALVCP